MHEQFNEYPFEQGNRNDINDPQNYTALQLGHDVVWVNQDAIDYLYDNVVKHVELSPNTTLSIPVRGRVHVITEDQLPKLKARLETMVGNGNGEENGGEEENGEEEGGEGEEE